MNDDPWMKGLELDFEEGSAFYEALKADGAAVAEAKGYGSALALAVLWVLQTRGLKASGLIYEILFGCPEPKRIERWLVNALTVERAEDLFA
ncbi:hypothetical protein [Actinomadura gamaensis]|uniref:Uncharacterized protein n=1 Tax=Actinomadura gamaensis TaxID=1763541 RepID=A0ABV9U8K8_9ACTN